MFSKSPVRHYVLLRFLLNMQHIQRKYFLHRECYNFDSSLLETIEICFNFNNSAINPLYG